MTLRIKIRFSNELPDLEVPSNFQVSLKELRSYVRSQYNQINNKRLKFIYQGKVILANTDFDSLPHSNEEIFIHCLVGETLTADELADEGQWDTKQPIKSTEEAAVGFDRLLSQGFSRQDVDELRSTFHSMYGSGENEDLRELEDNWIDSTVNNEFDEFSNVLNNRNQNTQLANTPGGAATNVNNHVPDTNRDLLIGTLLGCFLGVFALFLMRLDLGGIVNKRTKTAIIAGVCINFSLGIIRMFS
ncbi:BA75_02844T0 [Komagataella pastoris]|uniref:BA75_02844T0 n=1 Tax=Komagataella pastoris TaxID=4922 RepID=A0A1B2JBB8_PICPA|nr:BA75_02844T0 [Komagataella pastoris]